MNDKLNYKLVNLSLILIILFFIYLTKNIWISIFIIIRKILLPILISFFIAYILYSLVKILKKKIKNYYISCLLVLILIFSIFIALSVLTLPIIIKQITLAIDDIEIFLNYLIKNNYLPFLNNILDQYTNINIITNSLDLIMNTVIIVILSITFLFNFDNIINKIKNIIKKEKTFKFLSDVNIDLNNYINGLFLIIVIEIIEYSLLYFIVGHPNFLLIGVLAGITTIIPYFGGLFTNFVALITAISISPKLFIITAIIAIFVPIIDNYVIDPKIYNKTTKISVISCLFSIIISNAIFGVLGLIIAIPLYLVFTNILKHYFKINLK